MTSLTHRHSWLAQHRQMNSKHSSLLAVVLLFGVVGTIGLLAAKATTPTTSLEAESGVPSANASSLSDSTASGSAAVKFNVAAATGSCSVTKHAVTSQEVSANTNSGYPAGTQLYVPGGPDPWGGCFPGPANTGVPAGTVLSAYTGSCNLNVANTVIDSKTINCDLTITAANVTIKNSKLNSSDIDINSGSFLLVDSEVIQGNDINAEGLKGNNFTVQRVNMHGGKRQVWCFDTCTLKDSYLHDQLSDPTGVTHESAARVQENTTFIHNSLLCNAPDFPPDAGCSANQTGYPDFTPIHGNTMDKNLYMATSGGYCSYGGATGSKPYSSDPLNAINIHSTNNVFQRGTKPNDRSTIAMTDKRRYTCGYYGVTTAFAANKSGFIFSGNMWDDGLLFANDSTYPYGSFVE